MCRAARRSNATYIGKGLAMPHARFEGIDKPLLALARCDEGVPQKTTNERDEILFLWRTPSGIAHV